ncbi:MAG TPA: hypothetical protein VLA34_02000, partial [Candidatus Krumholzibacterium sp.]|nr:hypothetical protein [Candidatus Krumholzibacterium sp.]
GAGEGTGFPSWTVHTGFGYSTNYGKDISKRVSAKIDINGTLNLTENWKLRYTAYYDPEARTFTNQVYSVYRDLHCWEAEFTHSRFGDDWGFYFRIRIKDLTDIYHEVGRRGLSGLSSF